MKEAEISIEIIVQYILHWIPFVQHFCTGYNGKVPTLGVYL